MADEETGAQIYVDQLNAEAVKKGLELKAIREQEDALIAIAEEYLASLEPPPPEPDPEVLSKKESVKEPEKKPEPFKK